MQVREQRKRRILEKLIFTAEPTKEKMGTDRLEKRMGRKKKQMSISIGGGVFMIVNKRIFESHSDNYFCFVRYSYFMSIRDCT